MAQASFSAGSRPHLLPALRDDVQGGTSAARGQDAWSGGTSIPSGASLPRIPALRDVPPSLEAKKNPLWKRVKMEVGIGQILKCC